MFKKINIFIILCAVVCSLFFCGCKNKEEITNCVIKCECDKGQIFGTINYEIKNFDKRNLLFMLYMNSDEDKDKNKLENRGEGEEKSTKIKSVYVDEKQCEISYFNDEYFYLKNIDKANFVVTINFETKLKDGKNFTSKWGDNANFSLFYPILCHKDIKTPNKIYNFGTSYFMQFMNISAEITMPSTFVSACGFYPEKVENMGEKTTYFYREKMAKSFSFSIGEKYQVFLNKWGNRSIIGYFKGKIQENSYIELIKAVSHYFENIFNLKEVQNIAILFVPYKEMEFTSSLFSFVFNDGFSEKTMFNIVKSICLQFLNNAFIFDDFSESYFKEGLSNVLTATFLNDYLGKIKEQTLIKYAKSSINSYINLLKRQNKDFNFKMNRDLSTFYDKTEYEVVMVKGSFLLFEKIKDEISEKSFIKYFKNFVKDNMYKKVSFKKFLQSFSFSKNKVKRIYEDIVLKGSYSHLI